ncbi:MAG: threonylcarbamoyl-AMP synthase [Kordiimonadaceae bacterium]|nr:threonylcarbamoyl-AMP synthase [Kordiimonadaceae bacterium]
MTMTKNRHHNPSEETFELAAKILKQGDIVSFPTETVYGLGADARNSDAVAKIYEAKKRPQFNPLIVHLADADDAAQYVMMNVYSRKLAKAFWPGPFTMVLPLKEKSGLSDLVTAGLDTVAIRVPENQTAHELLTEFDGPIAAPSANKSGNVSPTTADHVESEFGPELTMIIDGGPCHKGIESTILQIDGGEITLLRPGNITAEQIEKVIKRDIEVQSSPKNNPTAPGQLKSHYAPKTKMRLNVTDPEPGEAFLAFGKYKTDKNSLNLSPSGDLVEAAKNLFSMMRTLDKLGLKNIAVAPIPLTGLGFAINDRLERAAAPRGET